MIWKTKNYKGEEITWFSEDEIYKIFMDLKNVCSGTTFDTKEANKLKDEILRIINEVQNEI